MRFLISFCDNADKSAIPCLSEYDGDKVAVLTVCALHLNGDEAEARLECWKKMAAEMLYHTARQCPDGFEKTVEDVIADAMRPRPWESGDGYDLSGKSS